MKKVIKKTEFQKHRISFDLSEMAFTRSDPDEYSRSDRTMNIQSMLAVVDSLQSDIKNEKKELFSKNAYIRDIERISETEERKNRYALNYTPADTANQYTLPKSEFLILNNIDHSTLRNQVYHNTLAKLREYRSNYTSLQVNVEWRKGRIDEYWVEIFKKFSIPLACIIFVLLGAPIGMYVKKGNLGVPALIGAGFLTFYWISLIQGEKLADRQYISPFMGMWFSDILLAVIGIYLVVRVSTSFKISNLWKSGD